MIDNSIKDKTCIVTGAGRGIGYCIARELVSHGAYVIGVDVRFDNSKYEYNFKTEKVNLLDELEVLKFCKRMSDNSIKVDSIVNCAGITIPNNDYNLSDWEKTLKVNLTAPFLLINGLKDNIRKNTGSIINISSLNSKLAFPDNPAYVASKSGIDGLTRSFALDLGKQGIRVNSVAPGYIKTEMTGLSWVDKEKRNKRSARTMLGRWGTPKDVSGVVLFLISDLSKYITAQTIFVDGGWSKKGF